jgi:hypothetical protein
MAQLEQDEKGKAKEKTIEYFVNGERQETEEKRRTAETILANAGFEPASDWILSRDKDGKEFAATEVLEIHKGERFTAKHKAPTPTS